MMKSPPLVSLFVPSLAETLARAEELKGSSLTEAEALHVRDQAACVMMDAADAQKVVALRGYRDVNPDNCWADWHRLRTQVTGKGHLPKIVICVPGWADYPFQSDPFLREAGVEHHFRQRDERMVRAFEASTYANPTLTEEDFERISQHATVLYVLSKNYTAAEAPVIALGFLRLGRRLLETGGIAIKCESSGIADSLLLWIEKSDQAESALAANSPETRYAFWSALLRAFVQFPIRSGDDLYTCGMHLLGRPDLIVSAELILAATPQDSTSDLTVIELFQEFAMYLLAECTEDGFISGQRFRVDAESPLYRVVWEPCTGYAEENLFFNPYGRWRFVKA